MAGLGRRTHYRKHLTDSIIYDFPEPGENERIAKVVATRGSNQFDIILPQLKDSETEAKRESHLAILPTKFNKLVWVKRNDFVIVETGGVEAEEQTTDTTTTAATAAAKANSEDTGGIRYIISHILYKEQVKHLQSKGLWPKSDAEFGGQEQDQDDDDANNKNTNETKAKDNPEDKEDGIVYDMGYDDFLVNTNRVAALKVDDSSDSESGEE